MEAPDEILLSSLSNSGVPIPDGVSSIHELTPETLFSLCSAALRLIGGPSHGTCFPPSLPEDSMPERVKIFTDLASAFKSLGFNSDLSFHKFLYPSEEDLHKLVRFLVGKLSESPATQMPALGDRDNVRCAAKEELSNEAETLRNEEILTGVKDLRLKTHASESSHTKSQDELARRATDSNPLLEDVDSGGESKTEIRDFRLSECSSEGDHHSNSSQEQVETLRENAFRDQEHSQDQREVLKRPMVTEYSDSKALNEELQLLRSAAEMVLDGQHSVEFYIEQLNDQVEAKRNKLKELEFEWVAIEKPLHKKRDLEESLSACNPEASEKLRRRKEIELETEATIAEIIRREDELLKLSLDLEKQPKMAPRRSYVERITEITKNSRKQDNDIQQILKDTRELQLDSNTIQERLSRTYAIVDETIFREAKKDPVARQAYRLLANIHESFAQIAEKILSTDRSQRDAADYEAKLAIISARSSNIAKLQADLDAIRKENDLLEQHLHKL